MKKTVIFFFTKALFPRHHHLKNKKQLDQLISYLITINDYPFIKKKYETLLI